MLEEGLDGNISKLEGGLDAIIRTCTWNRDLIPSCSQLSFLLREHLTVNPRSPPFFILLLLRPELTTASLPAIQNRTPALPHPVLFAAAAGIGSHHTPTLIWKGIRRVSPLLLLHLSLVPSTTKATDDHLTWSAVAAEKMKHCWENSSRRRELSTAGKTFVTAVFRHTLDL